MKKNNINPFSVKTTKGGQTLLHRGNIPLHQDNSKIESDIENDIKNKLTQKEISEEKELETKITKQLESPVTSKWGIDNIPQIKSNNFNEAFSKARSIHKDTGGIGMFEWNGQIYGSALNTKEELAKYDNLFANTDYGKQFNKASNIYTGSGIAGETPQIRQAYLDYQRKAQENNPETQKGVFKNYEDYLNQWNIAKKRGASNDELNAITQSARNQDLTNPNKTDNVKVSDLFENWRNLGNFTEQGRYAKLTEKENNEGLTQSEKAERINLRNKLGNVEPNNKQYQGHNMSNGVLGNPYLDFALLSTGSGITGALTSKVFQTIPKAKSVVIGGLKELAGATVSTSVPVLALNATALMSGKKLSEEDINTAIKNGLIGYVGGRLVMTKKGQNILGKTSNFAINNKVTNKLSNEVKNIKNDLKGVNPFHSSKWVDIKLDAKDLNMKQPFNSTSDIGAYFNYIDKNKFSPPKRIPFPDIVPIPKKTIPKSNYTFSNTPIKNNNPIVATSNYKKPLYNVGNIPTLPSQPVVLKPAYNNPNIVQSRITSGNKIQSNSKATPISKSSQEVKYKPEDEDLRFLLKNAVGNSYIKKGNKTFRKINGDWFEIKAQGGKLNPFKYADGGGINPFLPKNPYDRSNELGNYTNDEFEIGQSMDNAGVSFNSNSQNKNIINTYDQLYRNTDVDYSGSINPYMNRNRQDISLPEVPLRKPEDEVVDDISNQPKKSFGRKVWGKTKGLDAFDVINAGNMIKGYMGRNIKPPKRSWEDRQDIIAPAQGMNPFQKQSAMNDLQQQANLSNYNNRTIDPRMNNVSMLGIQQNTNQGLNQLNSQDSQMYQADQQRMMGQKQQENLRMLQGKQNFDQRIQDENMRNYQMQQQASQQSINQGLNYMQMKQADSRKKAIQEKANNQMLNAQMYQNSISEMQQKVKVNLADNSVTSFDGSVIKFNTANEATAYADKLRMSPELEQAGMQEALRRSKGFKTFMNTNWGQEEMKKGGILEVSETRKPQYNKINPFKISNYTSDLMRMATSFGLKNMQLRKDINNKTK